MPYGNLRVAELCFTLGLALLAGTAEAQIPVSATPVIPTPLTSNGSAPTRSLMESASYWRSRGDPVAALHALERVLSFKPTDPDVLAMAAEVAFQANDYEAATRYRARLTRVAPADPRLQTLAAERPLEPEQESLLVQARQRAQEGKNAEAVAKFKQLFAGRVIPGLAVEYYGVLALTPGGFDEANQELSMLVERAPQDAQLQLAYGRLLVLQDDTRDEGIKRLAMLAKLPGIETAASHIWREALLWQGPGEKSRDQLDAYLRRYPGDKAIEAKSREFTAMLPDESSKALMRGYYAMSVNETGKAEQEFAEAYKLNPRNANAAFMLAVFRRSHGREAEAQSLIAQAIAAAPERRDEFIEASGGPVGAWLSPNAEQRVKVSLLNATGKYDEAEQLLASISLGHETASTYTQLGEIQMRAGRLDDAETSFQKARALAPHSGDAVCGQANVMMRRGHLDEASALFSQAAVLYGRGNNPGGMWRVWTGRAELMRTRVSGLDAAQAVGLYQTSLAADPRDMPMRLDVGRLLRQMGRDAQAWSVVARGVELNPGNRVALQLAMNFADQGGDREHAAQLARQLDQIGRAPTVRLVSRRSPPASHAGRLQPIMAVQP